MSTHPHTRPRHQDEEDEPSKPTHKAEKAAKTAEESHNDFLETLHASQAGAVQERVNALMVKFPELQGAMQLPPPPEPPPEDTEAHSKRRK